jgi:hypothetical protein
MSVSLSGCEISPFLNDVRFKVASWVYEYWYLGVIYIVFIATMVIVFRDKE